jgi:hypothetical protein
VEEVVERSMVVCVDRSPCDEEEGDGNPVGIQDQGAKSEDADTRRLLAKVEHEQLIGSLVIGDGYELISCFFHY